MRYKAVPHTLEGKGGWAIWDNRLSRDLLDEGVTPYVCSLDGKTPLMFPYLSHAYGWLAACERAGLDMEDDPDLVRVAVSRSGRGGTTYVNHLTGSGPVIREVPEPWQED